MHRGRWNIPRLIIQASILLLLGAIVNIAVAWGCAAAHPYVPDPFQGDPMVSIPAHELQWIVIDAPLPATEEEARWHRFLDFTGVGEVITKLGVTEYLLATGSGIFFLNRELHSGWPLRSMRGRCFEIDYQREVSRSLHQVTLPTITGPRDIPTALLWPGFAINTLFYAAILWLLLALPGALRRWRRIKRGLCPACAYPVGTSTVCTECGEPAKAE